VQLIGFVPGVGTARDVTVDAADHLAYVASEEYGLVVLDVADMSAPQVLGAADVPFVGRFIALHPPYAVVSGPTADGQAAALRVLDVSVPDQPVIIGTLTTAEVPAFYEVAVNGSGSVAVVATGTAGIWTIDLRNPYAPAHLGTYNTTGFAQGVAIDGTRAFIADGSTGLVVVDLTNPAQPGFLGSKAFTGGSAADVTVVGTWAYVADTSWWLRVLDVSGATPTLVTSRSLSGSADRMAAAGTRLALLGTNSANDILEIFTIASPGAPARESTVALGAVGSAQGLAFVGDDVFVANMTAGVRVFDVSVAASPMLQGTASDTFLGTTIAQAGAVVAVAGTDQVQNTATLKILDAATVHEVGSLSTAVVTTFAGVALNASGTIAAVSLGPLGIWVVDLSNPAAPLHVGTYDTLGYAQGVAISGTRLYVADGSTGLVVLDISTPAQPTFLGSRAFTGGTARDVAVAGSWAYVGDSSWWVRVLDITAAVPVLKTSRSLAGSADHIATYGHLVAVLTTNGTGDAMELWDVTTPTSPGRQSTLPLGPVGSAEGVALSATHAYVGNRDAGLKIFDLASATTPTLVATGTTVGTAYGVALNLPRIYVADFPAIVTVFDLSAP
jgi:hypothetical protein